MALGEPFAVSDGLEALRRSFVDRLDPALCSRDCGEKRYAICLAESFARLRLMGDALTWRCGRREGNAYGVRCVLRCRRVLNRPEINLDGALANSGAREMLFDDIPV